MELTLNNLVKIIIGILLFVIVVLGLYMFFRNYVFEFFKTGNETVAGSFISLLI